MIKELVRIKPSIEGMRIMVRFILVYNELISCKLDGVCVINIFLGIGDVCTNFKVKI